MPIFLQFRQMLIFRPAIGDSSDSKSGTCKWRWDCTYSKSSPGIGRKMTLKIEKRSDRHTTTIQLIGRMQAKQVPAVQAVINQSTPRIVLDLRELTLVDVEAVRFLRSCRRGGLALLHCPPYIRSWIANEDEVVTDGVPQFETKI